MKKICFVLTVNFGSLFADTEFLKEYFSKDYDVSLNYLRDKDSVDYLVVSVPFTPFKNENDLPIIEVPAVLFMEKDFETIKDYIDNYFASTQAKN
ncbi:hypothetical protein [Enterococcus malodoratus]|uniref:PTS EIIB type-3 domain-containing protein n=1 Tax=Enterococcus malodoratus ATCC 43197 TaxID=1158601 RepID=R2RC38_9ENTE|nr:hypothetical protein [Enterococcus malodoratus]EOH73504.1 hypothetical protein UAI_03601 [Enterococcus malodoratus ATCC 43197]EOT67262.1 hypothetical protein I585_02783 [Enterococcus malodoratus ATCC 43197]SPW90860.1 Uncharacterised protein [Enterococcus malodoratus]STD69486.1 Uncharacterised protein [Enterococcus malodoratus]